MNNGCEEIVAALATGGPIRRWKARWHAARCSRCAAARDELRRVARALAGVAPLTAAERRLWIAAAETPSANLRAWWFRPALAGVTATVIVAAVGVWWAFRPADLPHHLPAVTDVTPPVVHEGSSPDVEDLRGRVIALAQELEELRRRADLLDARKDVDALMARLGPMGGSSGH